MTTQPVEPNRRGGQWLDELTLTQFTPLYNLLDDMPVMIAYIDRQQVCRYANYAIAQWLNFERNDCIDAHLQQLFGVEGYQVLHDTVRRALDGHYTTLDYDLPHVDGRPRYAQLTFNPHLNAQARANGFYLMVHDVTSQQAHLRQIIEAEKSRLLGNFIQDVAHDFRTPLSLIFTGLYLLRRQEDPQKREDRINQIETQVTRLSNLLDGLLMMSRLDNDVSVEWEWIDINSLLLDINAELLEIAGRKRFSVRLDLGDRLPPVQVDPHRIRLALLKLFDNAFHFTAEGGTITTRTYVRDDKYLFVEIEDTGIGIEPDDMPHIFERFYRADKARRIDTGGAGMGLAVVQKVVQQHRAKIEVESNPGVGSIFRLRFLIERV